MNDNYTEKQAQPGDQEFIEHVTREMIDAYTPEQQKSILQAVESNIFLHYSTQIEDSEQSLKLAQDRRSRFSEGPTAKIKEEKSKNSSYSLIKN